MQIMLFNAAYINAAECCCRALISIIQHQCSINLHNWDMLNNTALMLNLYWDMLISTAVRDIETKASGGAYISIMLPGNAD